MAQEYRQMYPGQGASPPQQPAPFEQNGSDTGMECPECGAVLVDMAHREKHAIGHYGEKRVPNDHFNRTAHERQSAILGVPVKERA